MGFYAGAMWRDSIFFHWICGWPKLALSIYSMICHILLAWSCSMHTVAHRMHLFCPQCTCIKFKCLNVLFTKEHQHNTVWYIIEIMLSTVTCKQQTNSNNPQIKCNSMKCMTTKGCRLHTVAPHGSSLSSHTKDSQADVILHTRCPGLSFTVAMRIARFLKWMWKTSIICYAQDAMHKINKFVTLCVLDLNT